MPQAAIFKQDKFFPAQLKTSNIQFAPVDSIMFKFMFSDTSEQLGCARAYDRALAAAAPKRQNFTKYNLRICNVILGVPLCKNMRNSLAFLFSN